MTDRTITLKEARELIRVLAHEQSLLLLSSPGVGKSDCVRQAAAEAGLVCQSLLGTQIAPEDVSGVPHIVGERSVFCPPRILLPERPEPFCLFLDELPAATPDIQKAFYSLLLERRIGEHSLPSGTWVVAAGNRVEDRALVRTMSSALVNRVIVVNIRVDTREWLAWAVAHGVRSEVVSFVSLMPESLNRPVPATPTPFSTPRSWASLGRALDLAEQAGVLGQTTRHALAYGRVSPEDAAIFCALAEERIQGLQPPRRYVENPELLPADQTARWFVTCLIRETIKSLEETAISPTQVNTFLAALPLEHRASILLDLVPQWSRLGADAAMLAALKELTGLDSWETEQLRAARAAASSHCSPIV